MKADNSVQVAEGRRGGEVVEGRNGEVVVLNGSFKLPMRSHLQTHVASISSATESSRPIKNNFSSCS
jgi:hypothetical protein